MRLLIAAALGVLVLGPAAVAAPPTAGVCAWQAVADADKETLGRADAHPSVVPISQRTAALTRVIHALNGCGATINGDPRGRAAYNYFQSLASKAVLERELESKGVGPARIDRLWAALPAEARASISRGAGDADQPVDMLTALDALNAVGDATDSERLDPAVDDALLDVFVVRAKLAALERWDGG